MKDNMVAVLDIGSSKAVVLVGTVNNEGQGRIEAIGYTPCRGIEQGAVVDIAATEEAIRKAIDQAERVAGVKISQLYLATGGIHISGQNSHGSTAINDKEVVMADIEEVIDAAQTVAFPHDEILLHALPQNFTVDRQANVRKPLGMSGVRLEVNVYLISGLSNIIRNLRKCASRCGLKIERIVVEQLADSYATLQQDERLSSVCLINIGAGTTKTMVIRDGAPIFTGTVAMGGDNVTNDIAAGLRVPTRLAEEIKHRYGCALVDKVNPEHLVRIPRVDHRDEQEIARQNLATIIQQRYEEILNMVDEQLVNEKVKEPLAAGVVLTGGGAAIEGLSELTAEIMHAAVRTGNCLNIEKNELLMDNPRFTTAAGLLLYGVEERMRSRQKEGFFQDQNLFGKFNWFDKLHDWVEKNL